MAIDLSSLSGATSLTKAMTDPSGASNSSTWGTTFSTPQGDFTFISEDVINKGTKFDDNVSYLPWFLDANNLARLNQVGQYVDLTDVKASGITAKDTWGNWVKERLGQSPKGFIVPAGSIDPTSSGISTTKTSQIGNITGIANKDGKLVYATTGSPGSQFGWVSNEGVWNQPEPSRSGGFLGKLVGGISDVLQGLGPITPIVLNAIAPGAGTGYAIGTTIGSGGNVGDVLKSVAISQGLSALGNAAVSSTAGTDTAFLQDMDQGIFTDTTLDPAFVQDMSQGIESLAPVVPDTAFLQDMDQGITPEVNLEGGDLGMTEAEAQDQYYRDIGLDPSTVVDTPAVPTAGDTPEVPVAPQQTTRNLTPQQISQLLKIGAGLFGGGAVAQAAQGLMGGGTGGGMALPTIQAPTPFTGTYSGMNMNDPAYYQQVQQNYNRLFPTTPANVAGPLGSWYQTKYVPDTTISNKLFGV
jgi:hypothetical protein